MPKLKVMLMLPENHVTIFLALLFLELFIDTRGRKFYLSAHKYECQTVKDERKNILGTRPKGRVCTSTHRT